MSNSATITVVSKGGGFFENKDLSPLALKTLESNNLAVKSHAGNQTPAISIATTPKHRLNN